MSLHKVVELRCGTENCIPMEHDDEQMWYIMRDQYPDMIERRYEFCKYLYYEGVLDEKPILDGNSIWIGNMRVSQCDGRKLVMH